ncbi:proton-conducting transporter membrane subunit [Sandaracinus amylolyticus]|uniref:NADH-ubiquinone oxidoreductase chain L n=1 Tax=Sandaracinus amylolyticus TaxID=927083 RepID=A0A0F6W0B7_9BACT|nr:proton-conducting transporter membrane subunit [Sandaracinus amylolyticus]AKF04040.1 NADH-ubiquinone oxidoreductase chain L [Sandaracinus amylolyticus]
MDLVAPTLSELRVALALVVALPAIAGGVLGLAMLARRAPSEATIGRLVSWSIGLSTVLSVVLTGGWIALGATARDVHLATWFAVPGHAFTIGALLDALSLTLTLVTNVVCFLVARFSIRYLHREPGYARFFLLLCVFTTGMHVLVLAGSYDLLFVGWELVGLASVLLIAFFSHRSGPVGGAVRAMITYRVADVGLLVAGILLHQAAGSAELADAFAGGAHGLHHAHGIASATTIGLLLLLAVLGKSAQLPLGGWLPRAMEGPTPSSALFYGALSVHAGVYLLLRSAPLLEASPVASAAVAIVGALTAVHATMVARTQSDAKSLLAYATITQVGLMLVEIGLHLWTWALVHMVAHAFLRLLQLLRTPSALRDAQEIRAALATTPAPRPSLWARMLPATTLAWLQHLALRRFFVDEILARFVVEPVMRASRALDRVERHGVAALSGWTRASEPVEPLSVSASPRSHEEPLP